MSEIANGNPLDKNQSKKARVKSTNFPIHKHLYGTYRFGENGSLEAWNGLAGDKIKIQQILDVNTYSLKAPLLTPITMNRVYMQVTRMAILPNMWNYIFTNPSIGDDIDATKMGTSIGQEVWEEFLTKINGTWKALQEQFDIYDSTDTLASVKQNIEDQIRSCMICEMLFSAGSLINAQGAHFNALWRSENSDCKFDEFFENFWNSGFQGVGLMRVKNYNNTDEVYYVIMPALLSTYMYDETLPYITLHQYLEKLRDGDRYQILSLYNTSGVILNTTENLLTAVQGLNSNNMGMVPDYITYEKPFDTAKLWAYQLSCAEFFTNDKVDYIYNAETFRNYIATQLKTIFDVDDISVNNIGVTWNGQWLQADWLSAKMFEYIVNYYALDGAPEHEATINYIFALFKYTRSLKYKDYFTGARTRPIAIGNTQIDVQAGDYVEVIDVVASIQKQRFLNVVNKIPRDLKGYTKGIFGKDVAPDWHNPLFLAKISETIYGQETENTGEAQITQAQSRTSVLKNEGNRMRIEFELDRNSIIIGIVNFDIPRAYSRGVKRDYMHVDRFDMFNPYLQYCGDQEIYGEELDARNNSTFGYTGAYMEYKQEVNEAFGGFTNVLKGWTFLDQYIEGEHGTVRTTHIGPDFIRSKPSELDRFYIALTGNSMSNYFHFIIDTETHIEARRKMSYNPQILG